MARVSYLRPAVSPERAATRAQRRLTPARGKSGRPGRYVAAGLVLLAFAVVAGVALLFGTAHASLSSDSDALARVGMPLGGGTIERVSAVSGPHSRPVVVELRGDQIWPKRLIPAHQLVSVEVVVRRPGWIGWLAGGEEHVRMRLMTPSASLATHYLTLRPGQPLVLRFKTPVRAVAVGPAGRLVRRVLAKPLTELRLRRVAEAGTLSVAAVPRTWESSSPAIVSWFPSGAAASAVASPTPGTPLQPRTPISLTFSKTVQQALGRNLPPVTPATAGSWHAVNSHTITFQPQSYGYGLGATVAVALPSGVRLVGGRSGSASWKVPPGSTLRLQQLLSELGYLPLRFTPRQPVAPSPEAQEAAAVHPPGGHFQWRYPNVPAALHGFWAPGTAGVMTQGALMAFQNDHGMTTDGIAGAAVWKALIQAAVAGKRSSFGYSFVTVSLSSESLNLWHNGHTVTTTPVNTGIASQPTASGTYPVYEHLSVTTMSGNNPDGSHYSDPGIQFVSYFNGGDALHAFTRAQYGSPQSLGCVEMALGPAGQVWPYTPIGTLVHVA
ncbi:MAG: L,D-transpeptidase family protein [Actinomycetota bacterium]|nr:L,D-transpeptidase family protein [Actinomycetota bacterium]